jgi:gluconolactonase
MLGISRTSIPDRICTGEYEGVVVRNSQGKVLGFVNSEAISANGGTHIANFALAGDTLVVLDMQRLWTLKLARTVVSPH